MKRIVLAASAALGVAAFAAPAQAAIFQWNVDYTGFFDGASISGFFTADETAATDGIVSADEFEAWEWNWSGNSEIDAFSVSSTNGGEVATFLDTPGFFVDGTPNEVELADGLDQGFYSDADFGVDLEFLTVEAFSIGSPITGTATSGTAAPTATIAVADPVPVPEPATILGLLTMAGAAAVVKRQKQAA
ncbi:MAG: PEP-CTERM sorting domain-containing protein [Cyanobacteria bacterium P01_D01_bin.156]